MKHLLIYFLSLIILTSCSDDETPTDNDSPESVTFTVIGDVPYNATQRTNLINKITLHNNQANSSFVVHVGDIKSGQIDCEESIYQDVSMILKGFDVATFIITGDNEYNDCAEPETAFGWWNTYFLNFHQNWTFDPTVVTQSGRSENFAWVEEDVLFIGVNVVGSSVHDADEWADRLQDDADWITSQFQQHGNTVYSAVVFGHANVVDFGPVKFETFTNALRTSAASFNKPVLFMHGDGHSWIDDKPWSEQNIQRIQIEGGAKFVEVIASPNVNSSFQITREAF